MVFTSKNYIQKAEEILSDAKYLLEGNRINATINRSYFVVYSSIQAIFKSQ
jgi:uncharacterized protein (UPF0332 family)